MRGVVWNLNHVGGPLGQQWMPEHLDVWVQGSADNSVPHSVNSRHRAVLLPTLSTHLMATDISKLVAAELQSNTILKSCKRMPDGNA